MRLKELIEKIENRLLFWLSYGHYQELEKESLDDEQI
jgi:hypothetical protein